MSRTPETNAILARPRDAGTIAAIVGFAIGGALILALGFWLGTRERTPTLPPLTLVQPEDGAVVTRPLEIVFDVERARLRIGPGGWGIGTLHIHAWVDGIEIMPGANDIAYIGSPARYRWTLPHVEAGERDVHLAWSDLRHRRIEEGASDTVRITIR